MSLNYSTTYKTFVFIIFILMHFVCISLCGRNLYNRNSFANDKSWNDSLQYELQLHQYVDILRDSSLVDSVKYECYSEIAYLNFLLGRYSLAIENEKKSLSLAKDEIVYASSLNNLSGYLFFNENVKEAIEYGIKAYKLRCRILQSNSEDIAYTAENLGMYYAKALQYEQSDAYIVKAIQIYEENKSMDEVSSALKDRLENLCQWQKNDLKKDLSTEIIYTLKKISANDTSINYNVSVLNVAEIFAEWDKYDISNKICLRLLRQDSGVANYKKALSIMSNNFFELGNFSKAIELGSKIISLFPEKSNSLEKATAYNNLAYFYNEGGEYWTAIELQTKAFEIEKCNNIEPDDMLITLNNLADIWRNIGNFDEAVSVMLEIKKMHENNREQESLSYARTLNNLATYYDAMENYSTSLDYFKQALSILKELGKEDDYTTCLINTLPVLVENGQLQEAISLGDSLLRTFNKNSNVKSETLCLLHNNLSFVFKKKGDLDKACFHALETRNRILNIYGKKSIKYIESQILLLGTYYDAKRYADAISILNETLHSYNNFIRSCFTSISSKERYFTWESSNVLSKTLLPSLAFHCRSNKVNEILYNHLLFSKGILLNTNRRIRLLIENSKDESLKSLFNELQRDQCALYGLYNASSPKNQNNIDSLEIKVFKKERELIQNLNINSNLFYGNSNWQDIKKQLCNGEMSIEFFSFSDRNNVIQNCALVITKNCQYPKFIYLCSNDDIERISKEEYYTSSSLFDLIWKKIIDSFPNIKKINFSPSGLLHGISLENLRITDDVYMFDLYEMNRKSSTSHLENLFKDSSVSNISLIGGLDFGKKLHKSKQSAADSVYKVQHRKVGRYNFLPGTLLEVNNIQSKLKKKGKKTFLFTGDNVSEILFSKFDSLNIDLIHIATHGFFFKMPDKRIITKYSNDYNPSRFRTVEDFSMSRSGLVLSGANSHILNTNQYSVKSDGLLTAKEISNFNLTKTKLCVLSACQSALGDIHDSEGVFGLQRGLKQAGVGSIMMSLWNIDDKATSYFMNSFYDFYLSGNSIHKALSLTKKKLRKSHKYHHPKYWAGFILLD